MLLGMLRQRLIKYLKEKQKKAIPDGIAVEEPRNARFGDLSTNAAMVMAPVLKKNPMEIAEMIRDEEISKWSEIEDVSIVKPGFINFNLKTGYLVSALKEIAKKKEDYGKNDIGKGTSIQMEYVSSNPTGDLHIGHGRWGALGDSLANIYLASGYDVSREYYINDYGTQAARFTECVSALYRKHYDIDCRYPEDGYPEETVSVAVDRIVSEYGDEFLDKDKECGISDFDRFKCITMGIMVDRIRQTLAMMGVEFDCWFKESSLYGGDTFKKTIKMLREKDLVYDDDSAVWFRSSKFGDEKDRVVIRSGGEPTYFASDIMYLESKAERGFDRIFYILGADHHGYVERLKAVSRAMGMEDKQIEIIIGQLVNIVEGGKAIKMSRRKGKHHTLRDLIEEVGKDAVRYFFSSVSCDTPLDFDIELAKQQSNKNPVYYIQYAHARIESIFKKIKQEKPDGLDTDRLSIEDIDPSDIKLESDSEKKIARILLLYPDSVYGSCTGNAPHIIAQYLFRLATEFHHFYNKYRIIEENNNEVSVDMSRLTLVILVKEVLVNALGLLNISAPEKM